MSEQTTKKMRIDKALRKPRSDREEKIIATFVLAIGIALGLIDQAAAQTQSGLRVPALIASLFLVANAINVLSPIGAKGHLEEEPGVIRVESPGAATMGGKSLEEVKPVQKASPTIALGLMALATWLGLMTLYHSEAPWQLLSLSLLAAFLIFSRGLAELPGD